MTLTVIPREVIWPGELPHNSDGSPRPMLARDRPIFTIHYTGGGLWLDPDDTIEEARSIQRYASSAGKGWEYNWIVDGQGLVVEYAGEYRAAHSSGENDIAIGVLLLVGFAGSYPDVDYWEVPTAAMIQAVRELRYALVSSHGLAYDHEMLPHREMPDAATVCPGDAVMASWPLLTLPPDDPEEDDDMTAATLWRPQGYLNVFLIGAGSTVTVSPAINESLQARGVPVIVEAHDQMLKTCLFQTGLTEADLVPGGG